MKEKKTNSAFAERPRHALCHHKTEKIIRFATLAIDLQQSIHCVTISDID